MIRKFTKTAIRQANKGRAFSIMMDLRAMRMDYKNPKLTLEDIDNDPYFEFSKWLKTSLKVETNMEPQSMCVSTVNPKTLRPSVRFVLLKDFSENGFVFFTNYESRKGLELGLNPQAAGVFYWPLQNRSVRFEGQVQRVPKEMSEEYFDSRPVSSRLSGIVSQ